MAPSEKDFRELSVSVAGIRTSLDHWIRIWVGVSSALFVVGLGAMGWCWHLGSKVTAMEQQLADGGNTKLVAELEAPKSPQQLQANLSVIVADIQRANADGSKPNEKKVAALAGALSQVVKKNPALPEAWQAAARLVSFGSTSNVPVPSNLPSCDIENTKLTQREEHRTDADVILFGYFFSRCTLELEHLPKRTGIIVPNYLDNGVVEYHGGIIESGNEMLVFTHCRFDIDSPDVPSKTVHDLLVAGLQDPNTTLIKTYGGF